MKQDNVSFSVTSVYRLAAIFAVVLLVAGVARMFAVNTFGISPTHPLMKWFDIDGDPSIPAWFSSAMLLVAGATAAACRTSATGYSRLAWTILACGLVLMSIDESAMIHENLGYLLLPRDWKFTGFLSFTWVIVAIPVVAALAVLFIPFLLRLSKAVQLRLIVAASVYLGGALGFEMLGAASRNMVDLFNIFVLFEEGCEMAGIILLLRALSLQIETSTAQTTVAARVL